MIDIKILRAAGLTAEQIVSVLEQAQKQELETLAEKRERNRIRVRNQRSRARSAEHTEHNKAQTPPKYDLSCKINDRVLNVPSTPRTPSPLVPPSPSPLETPSPSPLNPPFPIYSGGRDATRPAVDEVFEEFWKAYPKRDGANPKQPARKKFASALKSGTSLEEIQQGARRYRAECDAKRLTGTSLVAQAVTWLNQARWGDYAPAVPPKARGDPTPEQLELRRKMIEEGGRLLNGQEMRNQGSEETGMVRDGHEPWAGP